MTGHAARVAGRVSEWLRRNSERYLLEAAQHDQAVRRGLPVPVAGRRPSALFWRRVFVPVYRRLPWRVRAAVMQRMPGSHRRTWRTPPVDHRPAV